MTPRVFAHRIWESRIGVGGLVVMLLFVMAVLFAYHEQTTPREIIRYGSLVISPEQEAYCPGETMTYPVTVSVEADSLPIILVVLEGWENERGIVLNSTITKQEIPIVRPSNFSGTARRVVPDVTPGVYWLNHVSANGTVEGYTVGPITILDCTPEVD